MDLHINLPINHPAYEWVEKQADKVGAKGHVGTHIDCYTSTPQRSEYNLASFILDCSNGMPNAETATQLPPLNNKVLILYTENMATNGYGSKSYFEDIDTSISQETLKIILSKQPLFILIDSYGIGKHGQNHIDLDKTCEQSNCYVIENIELTHNDIKHIQQVHISIDLDYLSTGKPCRVSYE
jgi:kynurenine formamidase